MKNKIIRILKSPIITGTLILTLASFATRIIGFYYKIFLSRIFHEEGLGILGLTTPLIVLVHSITSSGIQNAITRYVAAVKEKNVKKAYCYLFSGMILSVSLSVIMTFLVYKGSTFISYNILHETRCTPLLRLLALSFPLASIHGCINSFFFAYKNTKVPAITMLLEQITRVATVYILYFYSSTVQNGSILSLSASCLGILTGECVSALLSCIFLLCSAKTLNDLHSRPSTYHKIIKLSQGIEIFKMSIPLSLSRIGISLLSTVETTNLPRQLVKSGISNKMALSLYGTFSGMAFPLILFPCAITNSTASIIMPTISEAQASGNILKIKRVFYLTILFSTVLGIGCMMFFFCFADVLGQLLFTSSMAGSQIRALSLICPFLYLSGLLTSILHGLGKTTLTFIFSVSSVCIRLLFVLYIIPISGFKGYVYGILISQIFTCLLNYVALKRYIIYNSLNGE